MSQKAAGIIYLLQDKFQIYINQITEILEFTFKPDYGNKLNANNKLFRQDISAFIESHKLPPADLILVIADKAAFSKEFSNQPAATNATQSENLTMQAETNTFLKNLPFKEVAAKTILTPNGTRIFAANQEIINTIKEEFENHDSTIDFIMPGIVFSDNITASPTLTLENATLIFQQTLPNKQYNLITPRELQGTDGESFARIQRKKDIMRLYALMSVFGAFIITTVVIIFINPYPQIFNTKAVIQFLLKQEQTKNLNIQIINCRPANQNALSLTDSLTKHKFHSLITAQAETDKCPRSITTIVFSTKVPPEIRSLILEEVKKHAREIDIIDKPNAKPEILITLHE
jgi:hypothetical protein